MSYLPEQVLDFLNTCPGRWAYKRPLAIAYLLNCKQYTHTIALDFNFTFEGRLFSVFFHDSLLCSNYIKNI